MGKGELLVPNVPDIVQEPDFRAATSCGAYIAVYPSASGYFNLSQAGNLSSVPSVGISKDNCPSGQIATFHELGAIANPSWNFSGYVGSKVFLGTSSEVTLTPPAASGQAVQRMGQVIDFQTVLINPEVWFSITAQ